MRLINCYRIAVFVPVDYLERVIGAVCESGLLNYGNYKDVLWYSAVGTGQFTPIDGATPAQGEVNKRERCEEVRLEFSIVRDDVNLHALINDHLIPAHPWDEPVIIVQETRESRTEKKG